MRLSSVLRAAGLAVALLSSGAAVADMIVTSPAGLFTNPGATSAAGPGAGFDRWFANNVRADGAAGITDRFARGGNGSIEFSGPTNAKADFEYYFSTPIALSALNGFSYEFYRDGSSTAAAHLHPALRLFVTDGRASGYLVYEGVYNGVMAAAVNAWTAVNVMTAKVWATGSLPGAFSNYDRTIADWLALLPNLRITALSTGIGSGWNGSFLGAVDNFTFSTTGGSTTYNFETAAAVAVPEPSSMALLGAGLLGLGLVRRRKRG